MHGIRLDDALRRATVRIVRTVVRQRRNDLAVSDAYIEVTAGADRADVGIRMVAGAGEQNLGENAAAAAAFERYRQDLLTPGKRAVVRIVAHEVTADVFAFGGTTDVDVRVRLWIERSRCDAGVDLQLRCRFNQRDHLRGGERMALCAGERGQERNECCERAGPMPDLAHVILHVGFCNAILRARPDTTIAVRVHVADRIGRPQLDRVFRVQRGDEAEAVVEFDNAFGIYSLQIEAPKYRCSASDYLFFIAGNDRSINEKLNDAPTPPSKPVLLSGTAPQSFLYVQPTFVLFDKSQAICDKPVPAPLPERIVVENDQDAYYTWLYPDASAAPGSQQLALRLRTPTHQYHYVRVPIPFPVPWSGWPSSIQFNVTQDMVDVLAGDPTDTLLCPKLWRTSAG